MPKANSDTRHRKLSGALVDLALSKKLGGRRSDAFLREATEVMTDTMSVERVSIWKFVRKGRAIRCIDLYQRSESRHSQGTELSMPDYPNYFASLRKRRAIAAHDAHRDRRTREFSESYLAPLGITSMLDAPIRIGGKMIGVLCLEHVGPQRRWSSQEQSFAASTADLIALSLENAERQRAVEDLRESEARYRALAENFPHGAVLLYDRDLRYVVAHGSSIGDTDLRVESLLGRTIFETFPPETCAVLEPPYRAALAGERSDFEIEFGGRTFEVHTAPVRTSAGRVTLAMAMAHDITERLRTELEIRKSHRLLTDAQAIARLGVFEWQAADNRVTWSDSLCDIFGATPGQFPLTFDNFLERVHPEDRDRVRQVIYEAFTNGTPFSQEERIIRSDGSVRILASKGTGVRDASGRPEGLVGICQDVTEIKEAQRVLLEYSRRLEDEVAERTHELREKQAQLVQSAKMASLGNLVAGVAHEINSPLGAMLSNWDIARRSAKELYDLVAASSTAGFENGTMQKALVLVEHIMEAEKIGRVAGVRIRGIISSLRNFARLDQAQEDELDIHGLLENTLSLIGHLLENRIVVRREYGSIPRLRCFPDSLNQLWMNLLVNAAQAIEGTGEIRIHTHANNAGAVVEITDTGIGIPSENRSRIFDPGFTTKGVRVGTGLGLAIAHRIVEEHRGTIEVESEVGRGSTFRVFLPFR